jgi:DNA repair exonuclease SbcCD ATPase subunit
LRLSISNFLSFGEHVNVEIPVGLTLIAGEIDAISGSSNGAGKSGLLEAITFAIWGKARGTGEYPGGDHLIRDGCTSMSVGVALGGLEVVRKRSNGNTSLGVVVDGVVQTFPTISVGDGVVSNRIGIDYDTFIRTAYFQQGKDKAFSELTSTEARRKVIEILGLDKWAYRQQRPKAEMDRLKLVLAVHRDFATKNIESDVHKQIEDIVVDLDAIEQVISDIQEKMEVLSDEIEQERMRTDKLATQVVQAKELMEAEDTTRERIKVSAVEISNKRTQKGTLLTDISNKEQDLIGHVAEVERFEKELYEIDVKELEAKLVVVGIKIPGLEQTRDNQAVAIGIAENEVKALEVKKKAMSIKDVGTCPVLGQDCDRISTGCLSEAVTAIDVLIGGFVSAIKGMRGVKDLAIGFIDKEIAEKEVLVQQIAVANGLWQRISTARASAAHTEEIITNSRNVVIGVEQTIESLIASHKILVDEFDRILAARQGLNDLLREVQECAARSKLLISDRTQLSTQSMQLIVNKSVQETTKVTLVNKLVEIAENNRQLQAFEDEYIMWDLLSQAFGPNGVPAMQIDAMKDEVEVTANNILQFGKQGVTIKIQLREQKKAGEGTKDVFKILVCDKDDKELPLFRFSGGEGYWVDLAVRVALYLVWRSKNGKSPLDLVMIDEGVGKVDAVKRKVLIDVLRYMTTKVSRVLLITHTDLTSAVYEFDSMITVEKKNGISVTTMQNMQRN